MMPEHHIFLHTSCPIILSVVIGLMFFTSVFTAPTGVYILTWKKVPHQMPLPNLSLLFTENSNWLCTIDGSLVIFREENLSAQHVNGWRMG